MISTNDLLRDSGIGEMIKDMNRIKRINQIERNNRKVEREIYLSKGINYELEIYFNDGKSPEFISLEGYENGFGILETYRKIGFNLNVRKLVLTLDEKKVKTINFKY